MSATADAFTVAIERAFPWAGQAWLADCFERWANGELTPDEATAIGREFAKVTRADIGREPLPERVPLVIIGQGDSRREIWE
jgi:hypothetical protein